MMGRPPMHLVVLASVAWPHEEFAWSPQQKEVQRKVDVKRQQTPLGLRKQALPDFLFAGRDMANPNHRPAKPQSFPRSSPLEPNVGKGITRLKDCPEW